MLIILLYLITTNYITMQIKLFPLLMEYEISIMIDLGSRIKNFVKEQKKSPQ